MGKRLDIVEEKFLNTVRDYNLIESRDVIVVGVSGGPDSITLLTCLNKYKEKFNYKIIVAHINHLIRKDSTEDEQFVENYCKKNDIPIFIKRAKVEEIAKKQKRGTEETGRKIRYDFFNEVLEKNNANKIAIAHNMNDNAETMILNLIRGTGLQGLEGIRPRNNNIIRPLINCKREEIESYCKKNNLNPRIDSTNSENIYRRNIIRNEILPSLKQINPNIVETLSRTTKIIRENNTYIKESSQEIFDKIAIVGNEEKNENLNDIKKVSKNENEKDNQNENKKIGKIENYNKNENKKVSEKTKEHQAENKSINTISFNLSDFNRQSKAIQSELLVITITKLNNEFKNIESQNIEDIIKIANKNIGNKQITFNNLEFKTNKGKLYCTNIK